MSPSLRRVSPVSSHSPLGPACKRQYKRRSKSLPCVLERLQRGKIASVMRLPPVPRLGDPVAVLSRPQATVAAAQTDDPVRAERRRRCILAASNWQYSGANMRLGRPYVFGAVQVAPTPRIRPREVQRCGGRREGKSRPSNLKLALVAYWYGLAVCAETLSPNPASCACVRTA